MNWRLILEGLLIGFEVACLFGLCALVGFMLAVNPWGAMVGLSVFCFTAAIWNIAFELGAESQRSHQPERHEVAE